MRDDVIAGGGGTAQEHTQCIARERYSFTHKRSIQTHHGLPLGAVYWFNVLAVVLLEAYRQLEPLVHVHHKEQNRES